jgi:putative glutamine amidotransferase
MEPRARTSVKNAPLCYRTLMLGPPLIGVTTSVTTGKEGERAVLNAAYVAAVQRAGGVPVLLPPQLEDQARAELFTRLQGVLLTGGGDLDSARFDEPRHRTVSGVSAARDRLEIALVEHALARRLPVLAICRGVQVLNVALGGSLYQDLPSDPGTPLLHSQEAPRDETTHRVRVVPGSRLEEVLGASELHVNSFHHQAIKRLGRGLAAVAFSEPDGVIEGAELPDSSRFVLGVQWHPEELEPREKTAQRLFRALVDACP